MILGKGESTGRNVEAKDLISNVESEKFENDVQDENEGEFHLLFVNRISLKSMNIRKWEYRMTSFLTSRIILKAFPV